MVTRATEEYFRLRCCDLLCRVLLRPALTSCSALTGSGRAPPLVEDAPADGAPKASASCAELFEEALAVRADCAALQKEPKEDPLSLERIRSVIGENG